MTTRIFATLLLVSTLGAAQAEPPLQQLLTESRWQYGLHGSARSVPIGLAFKRGITATVLSLRPDGSMRMDIPCRNEEFLRQVGGEFHVDGTWELRAPNTLTLKLMFRGESKTEVLSVVVDGDELVFKSSNGQKRLGRFTADIAKPCTYE